MNAALRRKFIIAISIIVVLGAIIYGFFPKAVEVDLTNVTRCPLQVTIEEEGRTRLKDRYVITAPRAGYMERIEAKVGDPVGKGQTVAVLEPSRSPALDARSLAEAKAQVSAAQAAVNSAIEKERAAATDADFLEKRLIRLKNLCNKGSIAKDQYDQIAAEAKKARALAHSAKAAVNVSRSDLERSKALLKNFSATKKSSAANNVNIQSPVDGSIFRIYRESEGPVNIGEPLLDIGNVKNLEVRVEVLSADAVKIKPGTAVLFKRWGGEGTLTGTVRVVEPAGFTKVSSLGVEEQRVLVIADITSPLSIWSKLGDAYRLEAHFIIWEGKNVLQVPASALFRSGKDWAVFVNDKGKARKRIVAAGRSNGTNTEIISGVKENEQIIIHPDDKISDGTRIKPRK